MENLIEKLDILEEIAVNSQDNPDQIKKVYLVFSSISKEIEKVIPSDDVKNEIKRLLSSFSEKPLIQEMLIFIRKIKKIRKQLGEGLPLCILNKDELRKIKELIMNALNKGLVKFKERFPEIEVPDISDTKVYIVGSRARGYSFNKETFFKPGKDVDILIVGDGVFKGEILYIEKIGKISDAKRFATKGFIAGHNKRFVPPFLLKTSFEIREFFLNGDRKIFGDDLEIQNTLVNFHIAKPGSPKITEEIREGIECLN